MARFTVRGKGSTVADVSAKVGQVSYEKSALYTNDDQEIEGVDDIRDYLKNNSKEHLLELKGEGWDTKIRDTASRYGPAKEYFQFTLSLDKDDAAALGQTHSREELEKALRDAVRDTLGESTHGKRHVSITELHTDTGNPHVQGWVHDFAMDRENRKISTTLKTAEDSSISKMAEGIRGRLHDAGIDLRVTPYRDQTDLFADKRAPEISAEVKEQAAAALEEAGGVPTAAYAHGPADAASFPDPSDVLTPTMENLNRYEKAAIHEQQAASARLLQIQQAKVALSMEAALKTELSETKESLAMTAYSLKESETANTNLKTENEDLVQAREKTEAALDDLRIELGTTRESLAEEQQNMKAVSAEFDQLSQDFDTVLDEKDTYRKAADQQARISEQLSLAVEKREQTIEERDQAIEDRDKTIEKKDQSIEDRDRTIAENKENIGGLENEISTLKTAHDEQENRADREARQNETLREQNAALQANQAELQKRVQAGDKAARENELLRKALEAYKQRDAERDKGIEPER